MRSGLTRPRRCRHSGLEQAIGPASAVRLDQARPYVLALEQGRAVERPVELGARGEAQFDGRRESAVEIASGLAAGATVLRATVGSLRAGTRLRLAAAAPAAAASR